MSKVAEASWTCARCEVTARFMPDVERPKMPRGWKREKGGVHCLVCRRELAAETALKAAPADAPADVRQQIQASARLEFEIRRDPERADGEIAKACSTSIAAVRKVRQSLSS
jgi:hypothetical protein